MADDVAGIEQTAVNKVHDLSGEAWEHSLALWSEGKTALSFRECTIDQDDVANLIEVADGKLVGLKFAGAIFSEDISFNEVRFGLGVSFAGSTFEADVNFASAVFQAETMHFDSVTFNGDVGFGDARFEGSVSFDRSNFQGRVGFHGAHFADGVSIRKCEFTDRLVNFHSAQFAQGRVNFYQSSFENCHLDFREVVFHTQGVGAEIAFEQVLWHGLTRMGVVHDGEFQMKVSLNDARVETELVIVGGNVKIRAERLVVRGPMEIRTAFGRSGPALSSLNHADITARIVLGRRVNLHETFWGDHDLTRIELADTSTLPDSKLVRNPINVFLFGRGGRKRLASDVYTTSENDVLKREGLAVIERNYRDLRRQLEDTGNHHIANDFYYGEMQARRRRTPRNTVDHWILVVYHLASEYGTRAWRAGIAWISLTLAAAGLLSINGLRTTQEDVVLNFAGAWKYTLDASLSFFRASSAPYLSTTETVITASLRVLGPALLAVGLLALRNRTKR